MSVLLVLVCLSLRHGTGWSTTSRQIGVKIAYTKAMHLSTAQIEQFERDGFVLADGFLDADEVTHLQDCYMATVDRLSRENTLQNVQSGEDNDDEFQVYQIRTAHLQHPIFRMLIHDSRLLDIVEGLLGPELRLIHYQGLYKPARTGGEVGWHQDNHYFYVAENRTISVWLALDDATVCELAAQHAETRRSVEAQEGFSSFVEKRPAAWHPKMG